VVHKSMDATITSSGISIVEGEDRLAELARMLGGVSDSEVARQHAQELLDSAHPAS
jgi:DNA repair protein RecN (Recombination protein N)